MPTLNAELSVEPLPQVKVEPIANPFSPTLHKGTTPRLASQSKECGFPLLSLVESSKPLSIGLVLYLDLLAGPLDALRTSFRLSRKLLLQLRTSVTGFLDRIW